MIGDYNTTETVHLPFNTFTSNDPSASSTITNLAAGDIKIHADGNVAERDDPSGVTISVDFDGITGNHMAHIDLSDNTDVGFYAVGSVFDVRIEGTTVDGGTINAWIGSFSIGRTLRPTTAGRTLDVTATGAAGIDWGNVENKTTVNDLTQTDIQLVDTASSVSALANNVITTASINTDAITAAKIADNAFVAANFAASSLNGKGDWNTVVPPTEAQMNARTIVSADYVVVGDTLARVTLVDTTTALTGKTGFSLAATGLDAISQAATGMVEIAKAVWDRVLTAATHNIATSAGRRLRDIASDIVLTGTSPDTAGTANTAIRIELDGDASAVDGAYDPAIVIITAGTGIGQSRQIFEYDGTNKYAYVNRSWKVIPDDTSEYTIRGDSGNSHVNEGLCGGGGNNTITLNTLADGNNDTYIGQIVFLFAGTGEDQARLITAYNGTTKVATVDRAWITNPANGLTVYAVLAVADLTGTIAELAKVPKSDSNVTWNATALASINSEMVDTLNTDTYAEAGQGNPPATASLVAKIGYMYKNWRNKKEQTATEFSLYNDAGAVVDQKSTVSDDTTTATKGEIVTGA